MNGLGFAALIALYPILTWIYKHTDRKPRKDEGCHPAS